MKKLFTLLTLLVCVCTGAWASTVSDLKTISSDHSVVFEDIMNGEKLNDGTLYDSDYLLSVGGNNYANNKGTCSTLGKKNCCRVKSATQDRLAFKVSGECTLKIYGETRNDRIPILSTDGSATAAYEATHENDADVMTFSITEAGTYYIVGGGDRFLAGLEFVFASTKVKTPKATLGAWDAENSKYAVTLECTTTGSTIKYSTDNKATYSNYSTVLNLAPGTTLDAYAVKDGLETSDGMAQFTVPAAPSYYTVTYAKSTDVDGVVPPANENIKGGSSINVPKNYTMYKEGYTFIGWDADGNGTVDYTGGATYTVTANVTLTAVFESNDGTTLADRITETTITFDFQRANGAPDMFWGEGSGAHIWVTQANVAGKTIDVKADINVTASGKFNNHDWTDWVQINNTTEITVPSAEGATVKVRVYDENNTSTVNGNERSSIASGVAEYDIDSNDATALFVANATDAYYKYIEVILPVEITAVTNQTWDFTSSSEFTDATSTDKTYNTETKVNNLLIGNGVQLIKKTGDADNKIQRLKLNLQGTTSGYYVKIKVAPYSKITVNTVGGDNRKIRFDVNEVGGTSLGELDCPSTRGDKVLPNTGAGEKVICIYNPADGNITLYSITVESEPAPELNLSNTDEFNYGFGGFCGSANFTVENGAAYKASLDGNAITLTKLGGVVPANTGVIIVGEKNATATINYTNEASTADMSNNILEGTTVRTLTATLKGSASKFLTLQKSTSKFIEYTGDYFPANRAYFTTNNNNTGNSKAMSFDIKFADATSVKNVEAVTSVNEAKAVKKAIVNGRLVILTENGYVNALGQTVK